ncbi:hypothetical protein WNZ14_05425 [Hoeflea sp. AS60]|uniref:hypothetical protein n=1 Tax=Hoeflea sp. AS60 TaxID=3135780 RepID=UPI0031818389
MAGDKPIEGNGSSSGNLRNNPRPISDLIIGLWLFFLYVVTIFISILMLSSYQIQSRMQYVQISDAKLSIWRMIELSNVYSVDKNALEHKQYLVLQEKNKLSGITARRNELDQQYATIFDDYYRDIRRFKNDMERAGKFRFKPLPKHNNSVKILFEDVSGQLGSAEIGDDLANRFRELEARAKEGDDVWRNLNSTKANEARTKREIDGTIENLLVLSSSVKTGVYGIIRQTPPFDKLEDADLVKLQDAVSEFSSLKEILWRLPYRMAIMPAEVLVLFLVLAMGVLGSTIFITQLFFRRDKYQGRYAEDLNMVFFFSRPWFGAITAMSIYVLAKSGVLFLTDPSTQSGNATLSPFFISFIAIISGLFSEQAIQAIKGAADEWFKSQSVVSDRWGVGLKAAIAAETRDAAQFAEVSGVPVNVVNAWIAEDKPVPADMQNILSVWLGTPKRILFTDLAPPNREADPA